MTPEQDKGPSLSRQLDDRPPGDDQYRRDRSVATEQQGGRLDRSSNAVAVGPAALVLTRRDSRPLWVMIGSRRWRPAGLDSLPR